MKIVRSLTAPPVEVAVVEAEAAAAEEADEVPSEVVTEVGGSEGGGAPSVDCCAPEDDEVVLARSNAILIARYLHRCSTRALDVVLM